MSDFFVFVLFCFVFFFFFFFFSNFLVFFFFFRYAGPTAATQTRAELGVELAKVRILVVQMLTGLTKEFLGHSW